ncbi:mitochondrial carrier domain-containing protein [Gilbertella persicaria]|uniref:Mitochondrial dicarboxylate transporter n=1 Tax=Rhizopus stolonifer TaxID=4846 RepID=A0A367KJJ3_RHIST|nr:mitochondrial carrier domain-containing protein [Gilbertella persicaria]KAI8058930.1 mitochondrial carrier domain-containing protein [Gilbertella persicaria]RCI02321.1 Mitochondrial dicarboxylate transporter [Rhizopus stolonifer]
MASAKKTYPFYFGGAASCVAAVVVHPFDLTKVRLQNTKGSAKLGMFSTMIKIARTEGFFNLYAGLSASILRQATYSTVRFGVYEKLKDLVQAKTQKKASVLELLMCSSIAGALGGACGNPGDVVNVRMQNDGQLPIQQRRNYKHAIDGVIRISKEEGTSALFRGLGPNVNRAILMTSAQCVSYDMFKYLILNHTPMQDGIPVHLTSSVLAGLVATTVCSPVDVIKTRIMSASTGDHKMSATQIMKQMFKAEGVSSFFKGWTPAFIRLGPQTIITFVVLEQFKSWYDLLQSKKSTAKTVAAHQI